MEARQTADCLARAVVDAPPPAGRRRSEGYAVPIRFGAQPV